MMLFTAQEAADLCGLPYATLMEYSRRWPWLVYRDERREFNPETRGLPRAFVPLGYLPLIMLIRLAHSGRGMDETQKILRAFYWPRLISGSLRLVSGELVYYPQAERAEIIDLEQEPERLQLDTISIVFPLGHLYRMMERARAQEGAGRLVAGPVASRLASELTDAFDAFYDA